VAKGDDFEVAGVHASGLDGGLVGFGTAVGEERFFQRAGRDLGQLFGERHHGLVGEASRDVLHLVDLGLGLFRDAGIAMADADGNDAAKEIEILLAFHVPDMLHGGVVHGDGIGVVVGDGWEDEFLLLAIDLFAGKMALIDGCSSHNGLVEWRSINDKSPFVPGGKIETGLRIAELFLGRCKTIRH
jgi:hypothetical protein